MTGLCRAPTYLSSALPFFPRGLLLPTSHSLGHSAWLFLNTEPTAGRPGVLGPVPSGPTVCHVTMSETAREGHKESLSPTVRYFGTIHILPRVLALLCTSKHTPNTLYPFHNMLCSSFFLSATQRLTASHTQTLNQSLAYSLLFFQSKFVLDIKRSQTLTNVLRIIADTGPTQWCHFNKVNTCCSTLEPSKCLKQYGLFHKEYCLVSTQPM